RRLSEPVGEYPLDKLQGIVEPSRIRDGQSRVSGKRPIHFLRVLEDEIGRAILVLIKTVTVRKEACDQLIVAALVFLLLAHGCKRMKERIIGEFNYQVEEGAGQGPAPNLCLICDLAAGIDALEPVEASSFVGIFVEDDSSNRLVLNLPLS